MYIAWIYQWNWSLDYFVLMLDAFPFVKHLSGNLIIVSLVNCSIKFILNCLMKFYILINIELLIIIVLPNTMKDFLFPLKECSLYMLKKADWSSESPVEISNKMSMSMFHFQKSWLGPERTRTLCSFRILHMILHISIWNTLGEKLLNKQQKE